MKATVDGREVEVESGASVLSAVRAAGPRCSEPVLGPADLTRRLVPDLSCGG